MDKIIVLTRTVNILTTNENVKLTMFDQLGPAFLNISTAGLLFIIIFFLLFYYSPGLR